MNFLKTLLSSSSLKQQVLEMFAKQYKDQGITKIMLSIQEDNSVKMDILTDENILVERQTYNFLLSFYNQKKLV